MLWIALVALVPTVPGGQHAFSYLNEHHAVVSLTAPLFVALTKRLADAVGLPAKDISGHSFRRGGATCAFRAGMPGEMMKFIGDWKSMCYLAYIEMSLMQRLEATRRMLATPLVRPAAAIA